MKIQIPSLLKSQRALIMGILNVTPDSFADGGHYFTIEQAVIHAKRMQQEGADIIDIGGESTHPGAAAISLETELQRVIPVIEALVAEVNVPISIDTNKPEVMRAAVAAGAAMINDVYALRKPGTLTVAAKCQVPICLMHMQGTPDTMQRAPQYQNIMSELKTFFADRIAACEQAGIARDNLILDPGFGFGKTVEHNMILTKHLDELNEFGLPILFGASRKASIGALLNKPPAERIYGSIAAAVLAVAFGAKIVRVHDVGATHDALVIAERILSA